MYEKDDDEIIFQSIQTHNPGTDRFICISNSSLLYLDRAFYPCDVDSMRGDCKCLLQDMRIMQKCIYEYT